MSKRDEDPSKDSAAPDDSLSIANELINARTARGLTQVQLAEVSGVSRSAIKGYESGRNMPGAREIRSLCNALSVTPNQLLFGAENVTFASTDPEKIDWLIRQTATLTEVTHRIDALVSMLTKAEADALFVLARALAEARHGAATTRKAMRHALHTAAIFDAALKQMNESEQAGKPIDIAALTAKLSTKFEVRKDDGDKLP